MLSLQGNTAVYLLYAHARIAAIGRKAGIENIAALAHDHPVEVDHEKERALAMHVGYTVSPAHYVADCCSCTIYVCTYVYCPGDQRRANTQSSAYANSSSQVLLLREEYLLSALMRLVM